MEKSNVSVDILVNRGLPRIGIGRYFVSSKGKKYSGL